MVTTPSEPGLLTRDSCPSFLGICLREAADVTNSPRLELAGGSSPASWSREEMRDTIRRVRRGQREMELFEHTEDWPTEVFVAEMLEQLLDETEPEG